MIQHDTFRHPFLFGFSLKILGSLRFWALVLVSQAGTRLLRRISCSELQAFRLLQFSQFGCQHLHFARRLTFLTFFGLPSLPFQHSAAQAIHIPSKEKPVTKNKIPKCHWEIPNRRNARLQCSAPGSSLCCVFFLPFVFWPFSFLHCPFPEFQFRIPPFSCHHPSSEFWLPFEIRMFKKIAVSGEAAGDTPLLANFGGIFWHQSAGKKSSSACQCPCWADSSPSGPDS